MPDEGSDERKLSFDAMKSSSMLKSSQSFDDGTRSRCTMLLVPFSSPRIRRPTQGTRSTRTPRTRSRSCCRSCNREIRLPRDCYF